MKAHMLCIGLALSSHLATAQEAPTPVYRQYATQSYMKKLLSEHPEMAEARSAIERHTFDFLRYGLPDTPTVSVVFHLLGTAASDVKEEDLLAQLDALNRDFSAPEIPTGEDAHPAMAAEGFAERAARPSIRFCPANLEGLGGPASGVLHVPSGATAFAVGGAVAAADGGGSPAWETKAFLNIWVAPIEGGLAGFAQMPGGPAATDGIAIHPDYLQRATVPIDATEGSVAEKYGQGRTLSHLVGSYLNLYELWNDDQPCADDYVHDTPIHNAPNYDKPGYRHISTCGDNPVEMTMNIMDNTDDDAQFMFTNGQMMRMYAALAPDGGPRAGLRQATTQCSMVPSFDSANGREADIQGKQVNNKLVVSIFPNPASEGFTVLVNSPCEPLLSVSAYDPIGVQVLDQLLEAVPGKGNSLYVNARGWATGMHSILVRCGNETASVKVMLER